MWTNPRSACGLGPPVPHLPSPQTPAAWIFEIGFNFTADHKTYSLTDFDLDLGLFLTSRQEFWWLGYGWSALPTYCYYLPSCRAR